MRHGLDANEVRGMYYSLGRETFSYFGHDPSTLPPFRWWSLRERLGGFVNAYVQFNPNTRRPMHTVFNSLVMPFFYEDEIIVNILHEVCHAIAGLDENHGPTWVDMTTQVGGWAQPSFMPRRIRDIEVFLKTPSSTLLDWPPPSLGPLST